MCRRERPDCVRALPLRKPTLVASTTLARVTAQSATLGRIACAGAAALVIIGHHNVAAPPRWRPDWPPARPEAVSFRAHPPHWGPRHTPIARRPRWSGR